MNIVCTDAARTRKVGHDFNVENNSWPVASRSPVDLVHLRYGC